MDLVKLALELSSVPVPVISEGDTICTMLVSNVGDEVLEGGTEAEIISTEDVNGFKGDSPIAVSSVSEQPEMDSDQITSKRQSFNVDDKEKWRDNGGPPKKKVMKCDLRDTSTSSSSDEEEHNSSTTTYLPVTSVFDDDPEEYEVEAVVDKKLFGSEWCYLIKWKGYPSNQNTWEPTKHLTSCMDLLREFDAKFAKKNNKSRSVSRGSSSSLTGQCRKSFIQDASPNQRQRKEVPMEIEEKNVEEEMGEISKKVKVSQPETSDSTNSSYNDLSHSDSSESSSGSEIEIESIQREHDLITYGPWFRRTWSKRETPLCIIGSAMHQGSLFHMVRLTPSNDDELTKVLLNPKEGLNENNVAVISDAVFRETFSDMLIKYYESNLTFVGTAKSETDTTESVARASLFHTFKENEIRVDASSMFNDMLGDPTSHSNGPYYLDERRPKDYDEEEEEDYEDKFGLPNDYSLSKESEDELKEKNDGESSSSSDDDEYQEKLNAINKSVL